MAQLQLTREQILAFRRRVGGLDERAPMSPDALRRAAWAGLQDSMPRAALLSLHARIDGVQPNVLDDPTLAQLWGPRFSTYVVPARDFAYFSVGRHPEDAKGRRRAEETAAKLHAHLDGRRLTDREVGQAIRMGNSLKYAATTGTIAIRWEGARAPLIWSVPTPAIEPADACRELARRYLHVFGPTTPESFARWAGISRRAGSTAFAELDGELVAVRSPLRDEWLLAGDEETMRAGESPAAPARLLPSGDAYFLLDGLERELLVPQPDRRALLWTPRVWPGALLVDGEIAGTWRRANHVVRVETWARLPPAAREAVEAEASTLPLPGLARAVSVVWD
ncbi:MAG TPA: crosslink repair DNA glycosylase YcaQ family protein [Gaiellaceae bacterium]|nr:crosslink repair DNA glycosylase YcaQ family protein [Gaiellaceae bacterium]